MRITLITQCGSAVRLYRGAPTAFIGAPILETEAPIGLRGAPQLTCNPSPPKNLDAPLIGNGLYSGKAGRSNAVCGKIRPDAGPDGPKAMPPLEADRDSQLASRGPGKGLSNSANSVTQLSESRKRRRQSPQ